MCQVQSWSEKSKLEHPNVKLLSSSKLETKGSPWILPFPGSIGVILESSRYIVSKHSIPLAEGQKRKTLSILGTIRLREAIWSYVFVEARAFQVMSDASLFPTVGHFFPFFFLSLRSTVMILHGDWEYRYSRNDRARFRRWTSRRDRESSRTNNTITLLPIDFE